MPALPQRAIVIVEDEPDVALIVKRLLRELISEYAIVGLDCPRKALAIVGQLRVALVIAEYSIAGMNGLELATAIKQAAPATRVLLMSALALPHFAEVARLAGADYLLPKPFALDRFEAIVRAALAAPALTTPRS